MDDKQLLLEIYEKIFEMDKYFEKMDDLLNHMDERLDRMKYRFDKMDPTLASTQELIKTQIFQNCGDLVTIKEDVKNIRNRFPVIERDIHLLLGNKH